MKKSFIIHCDSLNILDELTDEQAGKLFKAIKNYHNSKTVELDLLLKIAFVPFKNQFDRDNETYQSIVNRNKINGLKGGRPKTQDNPKNPDGYLKTQDNPEEPKKPDSDKDSDRDNVNGNKKVKKEKECKEIIVETKEVSTLKACTNIYNDFVLSVNGLPAKIDGIEIKALKSIIKYFESIINGMEKRENKIIDDKQQKIIDNFNAVLSNYEKWSDYQKENLKLTQINSNLVNIIKSIKNGKQKPITGNDAAAAIEHLQSKGLI